MLWTVIYTLPLLILMPFLLVSLLLLPIDADAVAFIDDTLPLLFPRCFFCSLPPLFVDVEFVVVVLAAVPDYSH